MSNKTAMRVAFESTRVSEKQQRSPLVKQLVRVMERSDRNAKNRRANRAAPAK